jgi:hypothetical protein
VEIAEDAAGPTVMIAKLSDDAARLSLKTEICLLRFTLKTLAFRTNLIFGSNSNDTDELNG